MGKTLELIWDNVGKRWQKLPIEVNIQSKDALSKILQKKEYRQNTLDIKRELVREINNKCSYETVFMHFYDRNDIEGYHVDKLKIVGKKF